MESQGENILNLICSKENRKIGAHRVEVLGYMKRFYYRGELVVTVDNLHMTYKVSNGHPQIIQSYKHWLDLSHSQVQ